MHDGIIRMLIGGRPTGAEKKKGGRKTQPATCSHNSLSSTPHHIKITMASVQVVNVSLPSLPSGWTAEKDFKAVGALSAATQRNIEPVGPHFLAHARRVRPSTDFKPNQSGVGYGHSMSIC